MAATREQFALHPDLEEGPPAWHKPGDARCCTPAPLLDTPPPLPLPLSITDVSLPLSVTTKLAAQTVRSAITCFTLPVAA